MTWHAALPPMSGLASAPVTACSIRASVSDAASKPTCSTSAATSPESASTTVPVDGALRLTSTRSPGVPRPCSDRSAGRGETLTPPAPAGAVSSDDPTNGISVMTHTTLSGERAIDIPGAALTNAACSRIQEQQRGLPIDMRRMMGLEVAAGLIEKSALADELCISARALNYKLNAERGSSDAEVTGAACVLDQQAERLLTHAGKLRDALPVAAVSGAAIIPESTKIAAGAGGAQ